MATQRSSQTKRRTAKKSAKKQDTDSLYLDKLTFDPSLKKGFIYWLLQSTRVLFLAVLSLVGAGLFAFFNLPRELNPEVEIPIVSVVTNLPGANPLDVEELITKKIEQEVANISTIDTLNSTSQNSTSIVTAQFVSSVDPDDALAEVKEKVDLVTDLPEDATTPRVNKLDFNDQAIVQIALVSEIDSRSLSRVAEQIQEQLESERSIRRVDLFGNEEEEIVVSLKPEALSSFGLSADQVAGVIESSNITLPAGDIVVNQTEYQVTVDNKLTTVSQLRSLPIAQGGSTVLLGEIAEVFIQSQDSDVRLEHITREETQNAVELAIFKTSSATIIDAADRAEEIVATALLDYPQVESETIINTAELIETDFNNLGSNFRDTVILVFLILFLFLGLRQASVASLSIPLTFLSAFVVMQVLGYSLNFLTLFSLLLGLGLVVDDAIVIVQAAHQYGKRFSPIETGLLVFRDFWIPIWTTTLTTVWAFLPLVLSTGIIGEFIKSIPIVVSATLISSTTIAVLVNLPFTILLSRLDIPRRVTYVFFGLLTIISTGMVVSLTANSPAGLRIVSVLLWLLVLVVLLLVKKPLTKRVKKVGTPVFKNTQVKKVRAFFKNRNLFDRGVVNFDPIAQAYRRLLTKIVKNKSYRWGIYALVSLFFIVSIGFLGSGLLRTEFFPKTDQDQLYVGVEGAAGKSIDSTVLVLDQIESIALELPEVTDIFSQTGTSQPAALDGGASGPHTGFVTVLLKDEADRDRSSIEIAQQLRDQTATIQGVDISVIEATDGPPAGADLQVNIKGSDLQELENISNQFVAILDDIPEALNVDSSLKQSAGQIKVELDERELRERDLSAIQVAAWLRTAVTGQDSSTIQLEDEDVDIIVTFNEQEQSLSQLKNLQLPTQLGSYSLAEVADFVLETSPLTINRLDEQRVVTVTAAANNASAPELLALFEEQANQVSIPNGYSWDVGGVNEENNESVQSILQAMLLSVILILVTMVLQLNSFRKSLLVIVVIPLAVAGVFFNFTMVRIPLSFPALIGVLALFGIVVNNSIMLVEKINQNLRFGLEFYDAIIDACTSRVEPIFFTSLTTTIGLLPITISDPLWRGLGGAIIAGLLVSGSLILFLLPAMYVEVYAGSEENKAKK